MEQSKHKSLQQASSYDNNASRRSGRAVADHWLHGAYGWPLSLIKGGTAAWAKQIRR
jgi:hypothetical protein